MRKSQFRKGLVVAVIVLFVGASVVSSTGNIVSENYSQPDTVYVDDDYNESTPGWGYDHFDTIQDGVDAVNESGTVHVCNGTYIKNAIINKSINLIGEDKNSTILDITNYSNTVFTDCIEIASNNVNISDFTITNGDTCAISIRTLGNNCKINNCIIVDNLDGLRLLSGNSIEILNCSINHSRHCGIEISHASDIIIENCTVYDTWGADEQIDGVGIFIKQRGENILVRNCDIFDNRYYGVYIEKCCWPCPNEEPTNISVIKCNIVNNIECGISIKDLIGGIIKNCNLTNCAYGIRIFSSSLNITVYNNNFFNNSINAYDESNNSWFNATLQEGNYWSDYTGEDNNGDGIGDAPYNITGGSNQDLYPLMYPWYPTHPDTVYVDDDYDNSTPGWGYDRFNRIQYGINEVEGSTVYVYSGTYYEQIRINKSINLIGEDKNSTFIDGNNVGDVTVRIFVDNVNISGFTIQESGSGYSGLCTYANNTNISNNIVKSNGYHGITVRDSSSNNIISDNIVFDNQQNGINIQDTSKNNTISSNNVSYNNYDGIRLEFSLHNTILNNDIISNNAHGIRLHDSSSYTIISGNNISLSNNNGIRLAYSDNNNISGNNICWNKDFGIELTGASNNIIFNNNILDSYRGIYLTQFSNNNNIITNCITLNEDFGIFLYSSDNNDIYHNNFVNNTMNADDEGSNNTWDNGYPSGGNYWSDYTEDDLYSGPNQDIPGSDGIGDTPYNISGGSNQDLYPLMNPFELYYILNISAPPEVNEGEMFNVAVTSIGGPVVPNATVEFNNELKLTDSDGRAYFTAPQVGEDTTYDIIAIKEGYTGDMETILVKDVPVEFVSTFIFGRIDNLTTGGDVITFEAVNIRCVTLLPLTINAYKSGELITISKNPFGFLGALLGVQLIFALCSASI